MSNTDPMLRSVLKSQYHASLAMLRAAIERCPPEEWLSTVHKNAFWQVSYHALFFAHLYLQRDEAAFKLWEKHRGEGDGTGGELEWWSEHSPQTRLIYGEDLGSGSDEVCPQFNGEYA